MRFLSPDSLRHPRLGNSCSSSCRKLQDTSRGISTATLTLSKNQFIQGTLRDVLYQFCNSDFSRIPKTSTERRKNSFLKTAVIVLSFILLSSRALVIAHDSKILSSIHFCYRRYGTYRCRTGSLIFSIQKEVVCYRVC